ncbi:hypothetical protein RYX36_001645 [Vicia faba]
MKIEIPVKKHLKNGKMFLWVLDLLSLTPQRLLKVFAAICSDLQIKSLKFATKFGNYKGFAFVEYVTQQEAHNALTALSSTHLYGRHLVIERVKEGKSLEEPQAQTTAQFNQHSGYQYANNLSKKRKAIRQAPDTGSGRHVNDTVHDVLTLAAGSVSDSVMGS